MKTISVIGGGAWGTALAQNFAGEDRSVTLWVREPEVVEQINTQRSNPFLKGVILDRHITAVNSLSKAAESDVLLIVTPAQAVRTVLGSLRSTDLHTKSIVICSKGFEIGTGKLLSQVAHEEVPEAKIAVLTGPTFASDIAKGLPSAMTLACEDKDHAAALRDFLGTKRLRPYASTDVIGTQIGGAIKNVIAIASGIATGRGLGESARAALITRGISEMSRLTSAMGGRKETLMGMCGAGDLILTCTSMQSRNYSFGMALGEGKSIDSILGERNSVTEGYHTAKAVMTLAKNQAIDMPVCETVYACLYDGLDIDKAIDQLLSRPFTRES